MAHCVAFGCTNRDEKDIRKAGITFHRFPHSDAPRLHQWIINTKRDHWTPAARSRLCSVHFEPSCFNRTGKTVRLKIDAVPIVFAFPDHLQKKQRVRKPPAARRCQEKIRQDISAHSTIDGEELQHGGAVPSSSAALADHQNIRVHSTVDREEPQHSAMPSADAALANHQNIRIHSTVDGEEPQHSAMPSAVAALTDRQYAVLESPHTMKRKLDVALGNLEKCKKKLKVHQQKSRRLKQRVKSLSSVVNQLKSENLISSTCAELLESSFQGVPKEVIRRLLAKNKKQGVGAYPQELRAFAMTLQFYSAKAYDYVRQTFGLALPHPRQIREWYAAVDADPGFTKLAFQALQARVSDNKRQGKETICALMLDEMAIRKHVEFVNGRYEGYVDIGDGSEDDSSPIAKNALVLMAVSVSEPWKVPVGYFLIDGMNGEEKANLVTECLHRLHSVGARVMSLTCDGPSCHFAMMRKLGADMSLPVMNPAFPHPADPSQEVHVILDVCHMVKLLRNTFADGMILKDKDGRAIRWSYIEKLQKLQDSEGLRLGTKLRKAHLEWRKQKMKVNLATQVFSASVADAIEYCDLHLKLADFQGSASTVKFLRTVDTVFDILNSRNPCARFPKAPMRVSTMEQQQKSLEEGSQYLLDLTDTRGSPMHQGKRKTGFLGLIASIQSVSAISKKLVCGENPPLKYLLTYKFSQDHLELFFAAVRSKGGFNNNPTCRQFKSAYKRLLMRHNVKCGTGNCQAQDDTSVLDAVTSAASRSNISLSAIGIARKYDMYVREAPLQTDHDYADVPNFTQVSAYKNAAISYIAGFVTKKMKKRLRCEKCKESLSDQKRNAHPFICLKDRGGLQRPSSSVIKVCLETEKCFVRMMKATGNKLPRGTGISAAVASVVLENTANKRLFPELEAHMLETTVQENHLHVLVKKISTCYSMIRLHHLGKCQTANIQGTNIRKQLSKLILFRHQ